MVVQKVLRHSDPKITAEVYGHIDLGDLRTGLERLRIYPVPEALASTQTPTPVVYPVVSSAVAAVGRGSATMPPSGSAGVPADTGVLPFAANLLLNSRGPKGEGPDATRFPEERQGLLEVGATGFEPATTCTPSDPETLAVKGAHGHANDGKPRWRLCSSGFRA